MLSFLRRLSASWYRCSLCSCCSFVSHGLLPVTSKDVVFACREIVALAVLSLVLLLVLSCSLRPDSYWKFAYAQIYAQSISCEKSLWPRGLGRVLTWERTWALCFTARQKFKIKIASQCLGNKPNLILLCYLICSWCLDCHLRWKVCPCPANQGNNSCKHRWFDAEVDLRQAGLYGMYT